MPSARRNCSRGAPARLHGNGCSATAKFPNLVAWRKAFSDLVPPGEFGQLERQAIGLKNVGLEFVGMPDSLRVAVHAVLGEYIRDFGVQLER